MINEGIYTIGTRIVPQTSEKMVLKDNKTIEIQEIEKGKKHFKKYNKLYRILNQTDLENMNRDVKTMLFFVTR